MSDSTKGVLALIGACTIWGLSPLFYALLRFMPPAEILSYRCLWSLIFFAGILVAQKRLYLVGHALTNRRVLGLIVLAAVMISSNWFGFIYAISVGKGLEASLGYYIFPLVAIVLGFLMFGERLGPWQMLAFALAMLAIGLLTYGLGVAPWIALILAATFGIYGIVKKRLDLGPVVSVTAEVAVLAPLALGWLIWQHDVPQGGWATQALLAISGPLTATPLILFSYAARRVRLGTVGVVQFLNPTLQFGCAVLVFGELFTGWHKMAFGLIWVAVAIYGTRAVQADKAARKAASRAATSGTVVM